MAAMRNLAISLIKTFVSPHVAEGNRELSRNPERLPELVGA